MNKNIIALIGAVALLSACETASQKVVTGSTASSSSGSASASSSVDKSKSLFAQAKQTASDKLIAVAKGSLAGATLSLKGLPFSWTPSSMMVTLYVPEGPGQLK